MKINANESDEKKLMQKLYLPGSSHDLCVSKINCFEGFEIEKLCCVTIFNNHFSKLHTIMDKRTKNYLYIKPTFLNYYNLKNQN